MKSSVLAKYILGLEYCRKSSHMFGLSSQSLRQSQDKKSHARDSVMHLSLAFPGMDPQDPPGICYYALFPGDLVHFRLIMKTFMIKQKCTKLPGNRA